MSKDTIRQAWRWLVRIGVFLLLGLLGTICLLQVFNVVVGDWMHLRPSTAWQFSGFVWTAAYMTSCIFAEAWRVNDAPLRRWWTVFLWAAPMSLLLLAECVLALAIWLWNFPLRFR
jgi:hypothetical protein